MFGANIKQGKISEILFPHTRADISQNVRVTVFIIVDIKKERP